MKIIVGNFIKGNVLKGLMSTRDTFSPGRGIDEGQVSRDRHPVFVRKINIMNNGNK